MKILLLTHRVPYPPDRGDRIRSYHLLKYLAARADVYLACTTTEKVSSETTAVLNELCTRHEICILPKPVRTMRAAVALACGRSATEDYFWSPRLADAVREWARGQDFDAVICYCSGMFPYAELPELKQSRLIVDLVDVDSRKWSDCAAHAGPPQRWLYQVESQRVERLERRIAARADAVVVISEDERQVFVSIASGSTAKVIGNGVDLEYFRPSSQTAEDQHTCCFVGVLDYAPNVDGVEWFCNNVWSDVREAIPDATFLIVGKSPHPNIRRLAMLPGVELHADVPDVRPYLRRSAVVVSPLRIARGIQNKVLEALAMEKVVIATSSAKCGLTSRLDEYVQLANTPAEWRTALVESMQRPADRSRGSHVRAQLEQHHSWSESGRSFANLLEGDCLENSYGEISGRNLPVEAEIAG